MNQFELPNKIRAKTCHTKRLYLKNYLMDLFENCIDIRYDSLPSVLKISH